MFQRNMLSSLQQYKNNAIKYKNCMKLTFLKSHKSSAYLNNQSVYKRESSHNQQNQKTLLIN